MIKERVKAGLQRAVAQGQKLSRPAMDPAKDPAIRAAFRKSKASGRTIASAVGGGSSTVQRIKREMAASA